MVAEWVRALPSAWPMGWQPGGPGFESCCADCGNFALKLLAIPFTLLSEETLKTVGPFYLRTV